jgi:hypothetical protein
MRALLFFAIITLPSSGKIEFASRIQPILSENCFACHGPDESKAKAGLRLDLRTLALKGGESGPAIVPGNPEKSLLLERISLAHSDDDHMPPTAKKPPLNSKQKELLRQWIIEGAEWGRHRAFVAPVRPELPKVKNSSWPLNPIDYFILSRLEEESLEPSPPADPRTLLRRRSLDLTGLPPRIEELKSPEALSVDLLLASPHYGEKWGRDWLDVARYADSSGYEKDLPREMHFYRDWVVKALNDDMGYDDFIRKQIAGTGPDLIATGYLRNSMTNEEGGAKPEQFRVEGLFDRMDAIGKGILGITTQCAQCHTHKYDPLTHEEYFGLFAFLNNTRESSVAAYTRDENEVITKLKKEISTIEKSFKTEHPGWQDAFQTWQDELRSLPGTRWTVQPIRQFGDDGQKYQNLPDGSVINQGYAATKMSAPFGHNLEMKTVRSVRLELLTDPYLALLGPGRSMAGTAALSEFRLLLDGKTLPLQNAVASVNPPESTLDPMRYPLNASRGPDKRVTGPASYAIDGKNETAWTTDQGPGRSNVPQVITFELATPLEVEGTPRLETRLDQMHGGWNSDDNQTFNIGRFRMSFSESLPNARDHLPPLVLEALLSEKRSSEQEATLFSHWFQQQKSPRLAGIEALWKKHPVPAVALISRESETSRITRLFERGEQTKPGHVVKPHTPAFLHPAPKGKPGSRQQLADWLVDRKSPTTARTIVNRIWQSYFGTGLVETVEDLGLQGSAPSHPELLDWLAVELMENKWSLKHIHRLIANSATYQQDSKHTSTLRERDPDNRLLARGPRTRVSAEAIRDIHLTAADLLNHQIGGRSVFPPAPDFLFQKPASYGPKIWHTENDSQRYRRALYTFRFRSVPHPMLGAFDAPSGDAACVRRTISTTPLQALVTLNEPMSVEIAVALGERILKLSLANAFERCTSRPPEPNELKVLQHLFEEQQKFYFENSAAAKELIETYKPIGPDLSPYSEVDLAAATAVAQALLNLDETITKN